MTEPRYWSASTVVIAAALALAGCAPDEQPPPQEPAAEFELTRPDPATMEPRVFELVDASWKELESVLAAGDQAPAGIAEAYARFGLVCFGNGLITPAEAAFVKATGLAPDEVRWIYFLALLHEYTGALDDAAAGLERVLEMRPGDLPALIHLGDVRLEQSQLEAARAAYNEALEADPDSAAAHYGLGRVAGAGGEDRAAISHFEAALSQQPEANRLNYLLGVAWRNVGDMEKARAYLAQRGATEPSFEDPLFAEISGGQARVGGLWVHMNAGSQAYIDGDYELAVAEFRQATEDLPDDTRSWQSLGMALNSIGDRNGAEQAYRKVLEIDDSNAAAHRNLANVLSAGGNLEEAERHLLRALEIDPGEIDAHTALARLLLSAGRPDEALARYDAALQLDPRSGTLAVSRAEVLVGLGRSEDALAALARVAQENPLDVTLRTSYAMMLINAGRVDEAVAEIDEALATARDDTLRARAHYSLGHAHLARGNARAAISAFDTAISLNPDHRGARLDLARTYVRARRFEQGLSSYESLLRRAPGHDRARIEAAGTAILLGRAADARQLLEQGAVSETASPRLLSATARLLTLARQPGVRDPDLGLEYAQRAYEKSAEPQYAETVALCLAATTRFDEAVQLQERLVSEAEQRGAGERELTRLTENLQRYRSGSLGRLPLDTA